MARSRRPIDPPELPAWRRAAAEEEDETPTLTGLDGSDPFDSEETQWEAVPPSDSVAARWAAVSPAGFMTDSDVHRRPGSSSSQGADETLSDPGAPPVLTPQPLGAAKEDPRALAQRLAAEAKARAAKATPPPPTEDRRDMARRLANEAKAKMAKMATPAPAPVATRPPKAQSMEDPRELAKRLAAEAKAKIAATPAPAPVAAQPPVEDPRALAKRLAAEAKAKMAATPAPAPPKAAPPAPSHLERKVAKPRSAKEILEEAMRADAAKPAAPAAAPRPTPAPAPVAATPAPAPAAAPAPAPAAPAPAQAAPVQAAPADAAAVLLQMLPGAAVEAPLAIQRPEVFQAVWRAHRTRAVHEQDWSTVAGASVLVDAAARLQEGSLRPGAFVACRVGLGGTPHAVFADVDRRCILAILAPADVYLAGLGDR